ncbi:ligand-binding sensor domain-containing protein [Pedobacter planticolens]|nr:sensor histidine kinase [Pedobacter planticolens]
MSNQSPSYFSKLILTVLVSLFLKVGHAQNYNFSLYGLKEGLAQSQIMAMYQDHNHLLWLGTYGGVSHFNGTDFTSYSKANGLASNTIHSITEDGKNRIILGTEAGISIITAGKIENLNFKEPVGQLVCDKNKTVWGLSRYGLFKLVNNQVVFGRQTFAKEATALSLDLKGNAYISVYGEGIYALKNDTWVLTYPFPANAKNIYGRKILFDNKTPNKFYVLTPQGLYVNEKNTFKPYTLVLAKDNLFSSIEQDNIGNLWIGAQRGAYLVRQDSTVIYLNNENGLSQKRINKIFKDVENNIWLSSDGEGLFKYEGDGFVHFDKFKGVNYSSVISGIVADKNDNLWIGTFSNGLINYNSKNNTAWYLNRPEFKNKTVFYLYKDADKNVWAAIQGNGIWKYDGTELKQAILPKPYDYNIVLIDKQKTLWYTTPFNCFYVKNGVEYRISGFKGYANSLRQLNDNTMLLGTTKGVYLIKDFIFDENNRIKELDGVNVLSINAYRDEILFGTLGDGIISWNPKTNSRQKYTTLNGLSSNDIYSLTFDGNGNLWTGTGRGINKLGYNNAAHKFEIINDRNPIVIECNQNAILNYNGRILVGTIAGVVAAKPNLIADPAVKPYVYIRRLTVHYDQAKNADSIIRIATAISKPISLDADQNQLTISFKGVFLTSPQNVVYEYRLKGVEEDFSRQIKMEEVEYPFLEPGNYTFEVRAVVNGKKSNTAQLNFIIATPFYATWWFKILVILGIILLIYLGQHYILKARIKRKREIEAIKLNEQTKIRKQTAEDFHDDIGNKLTRINVLSEILDKKITETQTDEKELVKMIRDNAQTLYSGTKDILWALDPKSDNLFEILNYIKSFGIDLFQGTGVNFKMEGLVAEYQQTHLSMEVNRNLTLIFKEVLTNALKYAEAKSVIIKISVTDKKTIDILVTDDGKGFSTEKITQGRGLNNIKTRANRIDSTAQIQSEPEKGTNITISTNIFVTF